MGDEIRRSGDDPPRGRGDDFDFRKDEYRDRPRRDRADDDAPPRRDDDGDGVGGQVIGWVVLIGIFIGINLITSQFGFYIIPIRR